MKKADALKVILAVDMLVAWPFAVIWFCRCFQLALIWFSRWLGIAADDGAMFSAQAVTAGILGFIAVTLAFAAVAAAITNWIDARLGDPRAAS